MNKTLLERTIEQASGKLNLELSERRYAEDLDIKAKLDDIMTLKNGISSQDKGVAHLASWFGEASEEQEYFGEQPFFQRDTKPLLHIGFRYQLFTKENYGVLDKSARTNADRVIKQRNFDYEELRFHYRINNFNFYRCPIFSIKVFQNGIIDCDDNLDLVEEENVKMNMLNALTKIFQRKYSGEIFNEEVSDKTIELMTRFYRLMKSDGLV